MTNDQWPFSHWSDNHRINKVPKTFFPIGSVLSFGFYHYYGYLSNAWRPKTLFIYLLFDNALNSVESPSSLRRLHRIVTKYWEPWKAFILWLLLFLNAFNIRWVGRRFDALKCVFIFVFAIIKWNNVKKNFTNELELCNQMMYPI